MRTHLGGHGLRAAVFMFAAVIAISFTPLAIIKGGGIDAPFSFNFVWRMGSAFGSLLFLYVFYRSVLLDRAVLSLAARSSMSWMLLGAIPTSFDYALFSAATGFLDASVSAVLFEVWPIILILLASFLLRGDGGHPGNILSMAPFLAMALVGLSFVVISQTGGLDVGGASLADLASGVVLALLAALAASCAAFSFRWGRDLAEKLSDIVPTGRGGVSLSIFGAVLGHTIVSLVGAVLSGGIGLASGERLDSGMREYLVYGFLGGVLLHSVASILFRASNLTTDNLGVNVLSYLTPIFTLVWLAIFSEIGVVRPDFLVIGAAATVAVNLLINFRAERLLGFKALVISLWACGTVVFLRDRGRWLWEAEEAGYFEVLFLSATVFALILSFRVVRLASCTQEEDGRAFGLFRELEELARLGVVSHGACDLILTIDEAQCCRTATEELRDMVPKVRKRRGRQDQPLPPLGGITAVDSTVFKSYANGHRNPCADADADWGLKHSAGHKDGEEYVFGYKMHMISDAIHGVPLGFTITPANEHDSPELPGLVDKVLGEYPWLEPGVLLADRGYDSEANHRELLDRGIIPVIHIRKPTAADGLRDGVYDAEGRPQCLGNVSMEYVRTDPETGHHLFRCPAGGCPLKQSGTKATTHCDSEVWEDPARNPRVLGPIPRFSERWKWLYSLRMSIERTFGSLKHSRGLEGHCARGLKKIRLQATMSVLTYQATVLGRLKAKDPDRMRRMRIRVS